MKFYNNSFKKGFHPDHVLEKGECYYDMALTVPKSITVIGYSSCSYLHYLKGIVLHDGVTSIEKFAFSHSGLKNIFIPSSVTKIDSFAFNHCPALQSVKIAPDCPLEKIEFGTFEDCPKLSSVTFPDALLSIESEAFYDCTFLKKINFSEKCHLSDIGSKAFYGAKSLSDIALPDTVRSIGAHAFEGTHRYNNSAFWENDVLYISNHLIKAKPSLSGSYTVKEGTVCIADEAFKECRQLEEITLPDSVKTIGKRAFSDCDRLKTVTVGKNSGIESIESEAFSGCSALTEIFLPQTLKKIGEKAFYFCGALHEPRIPSGTAVEKDVFLRACCPTVALFDAAFSAPFSELSPESKMCYRPTAEETEEGCSIPNHGRFVLSPASEKEWPALIAACNKWVVKYTFTDDFDPPDECGFATSSCSSSSSFLNLYPKNCLVKNGAVIGFYQESEHKYYLFNGNTSWYDSTFVGDWTTYSYEYELLPRPKEKQ